MSFGFADESILIMGKDFCKRTKSDASCLRIGFRAFRFHDLDS